LPSREVHGVRDLATFFAQEAPDEPVLYDGFHAGVFTYYRRIGDPGLRGGVLGFHMLLGGKGLRDGNREIHEPGRLTSEVAEDLLRRSVCRWFALQAGPYSATSQHYSILRDAIRGPAFVFVGSFPIVADDDRRVEVYRLAASTADRPEEHPPGPAPSK